METVGFWDLPLLQVMLLTIFFLSVFVEIKTGGFGGGILLGLTAAGIFFGSQYLEGLTSFYHIGLFLLGIICVSIEILMPTVGLLAALGLSAMLYSAVLAMGGDINAVYALLVSLLLSAIIFAFIVKRLPSSKLWNKFVLTDKSTKEKGYVSATEQMNLVGKTGVAATDLRPSGTVNFDNSPTDAVTEGGYVEKGDKVVVVSVNGSRVLVRKV